MRTTPAERRNLWAGGLFCLAMAGALPAWRGPPWSSLMQGHSQRSHEPPTRTLSSPDFAHCGQAAGAVACWILVPGTHGLEKALTFCSVTMQALWHARIQCECRRLGTHAHELAQQTAATALVVDEP